MIPIWSGFAPAFSSLVVIFSTLAASVLPGHKMLNMSLLQHICPTDSYICQQKLKPVEIWCSRAGDFFLALGHIKEHWFVRLRPLEIKPFFHTVRCWNSKCIKNSTKTGGKKDRLNDTVWLIGCFYALNSYLSYRQWLRSARTPRRRCWRGRRWGPGAYGTGPADGLAGYPKLPGAQKVTGTGLL